MRVSSFVNALPSSTVDEAIARRLVSRPWSTIAAVPGINKSHFESEPCRDKDLAWEKKQEARAQFMRRLIVKQAKTHAGSIQKV